MSNSKSESFQILGAILPLVYVLKSMLFALILSVSVLIAVFLFELIFSAVRRFWLRSLRFALAVIVLSTVFSAIFIVIPDFGFRDMRLYLPAGLLSAVFLIQGAIRETGSFLIRMKVWAGFFGLSIFIGSMAETVFQNFSAGIFWTIGLVLIISSWINRRFFAHVS